ncbi:MAG TPA: ABC-type transport auxiliary lipoprotein family protein [Allosphingosinicella sp.]|nr:ABC-type transport auxiliary lipoprotein family protein [Allosphingosinicella sp.]
MIPHRFLILVLPIALASCGGLLGGGRPAELYRFGGAAAAPAEAPQPAMGQSILVSYRGADFEAESRGDRILTATGASVSYVAEARWIAPASQLFDGALMRSLGHLSPAIRIVRPGDVPRADFTLSVDVRRFEAVYLGAEAPEALIEANVQLIRRSDRTIVGEWPVSSREPADANRVTSIVAAFDRATATVTARISDLTRDTVGRTSISSSR